MDRVDAHVHVFAPATRTYPREAAKLYPAGRSATAERLWDEMNRARISRAVLVQLGGYGVEHHRYVAHAARQWPGRFVSVGSVNLSDPDSPDRLSQLVDAVGIKGVRLMGPLGEPQAASADDLPAYAVCRRAGELGVNVNLYCPSDQVGNIETLIDALPQVIFSLDHLGFCPATSPTVDRYSRPYFREEPIPPDTFERVLELAAFPNLYVKISGEYAFSKSPYPYADIRPMVEALYESFGPERLMWCSDFPWICEEPGYERLVALIDHHLPNIDAREKELVMGGNALRVWFGGGYGGRSGSRAGAAG